MLQALQELIQFSYCEWQLPFLQSPHISPYVLRSEQDLKQECCKCIAVQNENVLVSISPYHLLTMGETSSVVRVEQKDYKVEEKIQIKLKENPQKSIKILKILTQQQKPIQNYLGIRNNNKRESLPVQNILSIKMGHSSLFYIQSSTYSPLFQIHNNTLFLAGFFSNPHILVNKQIVQSIHEQCFLPSAVLKLEHQNIGQEGIQIIAKKAYDNLTELKIWWNGIGDDGIEVLVKNQFPSLCILDVRKNNISEKGTRHICERKWKKLKTILIGNNHIGEKGVELFSQSEVSSKLQTLDMQNNHISVKGIQNLKKSKWENLTFLNLNFNELSFSQVSTLNLQSLTHLHLSNNKIQSIEFIHSWTLPKLKFLSLYNNHIVFSCPMKKACLNKLKELWVQGNPILQIEGNWQTHLKNLSILRLEFGGENRLIGNDLRFMLKMQANKIQQINASSKMRIRQKGVLNCLERKYQKIDMRLNH